MQSWESFAARIDALTLRERGFVMSGVLAVTYFLWAGFVMQPLDRKQRDLEVNLNRASAEIAALNAQAQAMLEEAKEDPNKTYRAELESLKAELARMDAELKGTTDHLVPPGQMARVLEAILKETGGLQLTGVTSLGSSPLVPEKSGAGAAAKKESTSVDDESTEPVRRVYKHGVKLALQGSFFSVLDFLKRIEQLEWKFFWDSLEFRVLDYPDASVEITVFTINLEPAWIGA
jgi:MSHA biogenesis protein MshJ